MVTPTAMNNLQTQLSSAAPIMNPDMQLDDSAEESAGMQQLKMNTSNRHFQRPQQPVNPQGAGWPKSAKPFYVAREKLKNNRSK